MALQERYFVLNGEFIPHYYLCRYTPLSRGFDNLSYSLLRFKKGEPVDVRAWIDCATESFRHISIPVGALVVRALHSQEIMSNDSTPSPLDRLAGSLAVVIKGYYEPQSLRKTRVNKPLKGLNLQERADALENIYRFHIGGAIESLLLVDDIFTSGSTMKAIIAAIRKVTSCPISIFTLAASGQSAERGQLSGAVYTWGSQRGWIQTQEPNASYCTYAMLKSMIEQDFE